MPIITDFGVDMSEYSPELQVFKNFATKIEASSQGIETTIKNFMVFPYLKEVIALNNNISGEFHKVLWPNSINQISFAQNQISGNLSNLNTYQNLIYLLNYDNQIDGSIPVIELPQLRLFHFGSNQLSGNLPLWDNCPLLNTIYLYGNNLSGEIPTFEFLPSLITVNISWNDFISVNTNFSVPSTLIKFESQGNLLDQESMDKILFAFDTAGSMGGTLKLDGNDSSPSSLGELSKASLISKGWNVQTD